MTIATDDDRCLLNTEDTKYLAWQVGNHHASSTAHYAKNKVTQSCFVAGTKVFTENGDVPIEKIKVGDSVYAKSEDGQGEYELKRVTKVFEHPNQEVWFLGYRTIVENFEYGEGHIINNNHLMVTPNHPIWVVGICSGTGEDIDASPTDFKAYKTGTWKRIDELSDFEVISSLDGELYCVTHARPISSSHKGEDYAWLQGKEEFTPHHWKDMEIGTLYDLTKSRILSLKDMPGFEHVEDTIVNGFEIISEEETNSDMMLGDTPQDGYKPFKTTVYNIEVEGHHTYYVGDDLIWVHNKNSVNTLPTITKHEILVL